MTKGSTITPLTAGLVLLVALLAGCPGGAGPKERGAKGEAAGEQDEVQQIWDTRCANCHGEKGLGDGPGAVALDPKPRSFADRKWQATTTDDKIRTIIVEGGYAVGLSQSMTANPDLRSKPEIVEGLVKKIRAFR
ncbi:MAG: c-type cytochrome [Nannocystaceae bacterium]